MGLFENIGKTISEAGQGAVQKSKDWMDTAKYNSLIAEEEKKQTEIYCKIGRLFVEECGDSPAEKYRENVELIRKTEKIIDEYKAKIKELRGVIRCEQCGEEIAPGSSFCPNCGCKLKLQEENVKIEKRCKWCNSVLRDDIKFCTSCGRPVDVN